MQTLIQKRNQIKNQINRQAVREKTDIDALWQLIHQWTEIEFQIEQDSLFGLVVLDEEEE